MIKQINLIINNCKDCPYCRCFQKSSNLLVAECWRTEHRIEIISTYIEEDIEKALSNEIASFCPLFDWEKLLKGVNDMMNDHTFYVG